MTEKLTKAERVHALVNESDFPGMSQAFDDHIGAAVWTDPAWRSDASLWASAWKKAIAYKTKSAIEGATAPDNIHSPFNACMHQEHCKRWKAQAEQSQVQVTDEMAYAFQRAISDAPLSADEVDDVKHGLRAAFAHIIACAPGDVGHG